jgi:hypothetical protein
MQRSNNALLDRPVAAEIVGASQTTTRDIFTEQSIPPPPIPPEPNRDDKDLLKDLWQSATIATTFVLAASAPTVAFVMDEKKLTPYRHAQNSPPLSVPKFTGGNNRIASRRREMAIEDEPQIIEFDPGRLRKPRNESVRLSSPPLSRQSEK